MQFLLSLINTIQRSTEFPASQHDLPAPSTEINIHQNSAYAVIKDDEVATS